MDYISIVDVTWDSVLVRYSISASAIVKVTVSSATHTLEKATRELNRIGRINLTGLQADCDYTMQVQWHDREKIIQFHTLPQPEGELLFQYAVIGDPHLAMKYENRFGRLHIESPTILQQVIKQINDLNVDCLLIPGDIVDTGSPQEYQRAAEIFASLNCPLLTVPGNHDLAHGKPSITAWLNIFGTFSWQANLKNMPVIGCNTAQGKIGTAENIKLIKAISSVQPFIMLSHYQLFADDHIIGTDKQVSDHAEQHELLDQLSAKHGIIYIGHKNVAARVDIGNCVQLNVPQITHFPCGYLWVRCYKNGFYHTFMPIASEILNEYSRTGSLDRNTADTTNQYRDKFSFEHWNVVLVSAQK
ncbi:MAG: metallophosphoesterase [Victivallaceae bacterium]|nr:metallophosphoesterase [Victivallaceae bacterium]